ncbi:MAG: hypothetical protein WC532_06290 [Candidatus Omnitrophota bacterium]
MAIAASQLVNYGSIKEAKPNTKAKCIRSTLKRLKLSERYFRNLSTGTASIR